MLLYPHSFAGLPLLYQVAGSAVPRAVVPALMSMALTLIIEETLSQDFLNHIFAHPYPYTVFANLVGFTLVFRNNIAYNRYWEGITQLRQMSAKWGDVRYRSGSNLPHLEHLPPCHAHPTAPCCRCVQSAFLVLSMDCHEKPNPNPLQPGQHTLSSTRQLYRAAVCHRLSNPNNTPTLTLTFTPTPTLTSLTPTLTPIPGLPPLLAASCHGHRPPPPRGPTARVHRSDRSQPHRRA